MLSRLGVVVGAITTDVQEQITTQFTEIGTDVIGIIVPIIGVGLGIFAIIMGIKYGKKMFKTVAN